MKEIRQLIRFINQHPLASKHLLLAYKQFFLWQLSQFPRSSEKIVPFIGNTKLLIRKGLTGATGNVYTGLHDFSDMGFLLHFLRKEDIFADVGANVGSYTILASGHIGAKTFAFEPVPSTFEWLQKNVKLNELGRKVKALNIGLGAEKGSISFTTAFDTINHVATANELTAPNGKIKAVMVEPFDNFFDDNEVPALVKIDVEGFETKVVEGMSRTMRSDSLKAIIIELNGSGYRYGFDESRIDKKLRDMSFRPYTYDPFERRLTLLHSYNNLNTIYIRDVAHVQQRIAEAGKIRIFREWI